MTPEKMDRLDKALAVELMGWRIEEGNRIGDSSPGLYAIDQEGTRHILRSPYSSLPNFPGKWSPTRNISQALGDGGPGTVVVGEMRKTNKPCFCLSGDICGNFIAEFANFVGDKVVKMNKNPALAICLAAAAALGIKWEEE